jgi:hypothetical protein
VLRRIPSAVAAKITHLSIECYLTIDEATKTENSGAYGRVLGAPGRVPAYHMPVMNAYKPERSDGLEELHRALRQHGANFTALRGLEIVHPSAGFYNLGNDRISEVVLGLCARALVRNTRRSLRHLALKAKINFSFEDFQGCIGFPRKDLDFLNADLTPFVGLSSVPAPHFDERMAPYQARHEALSRIAQEQCPHLRRI